jgi:outer membrane protein assembly factor BamD
MRRRLINLLLALLLLALAACHHKNTPSPLANVDSKQPDKVLFERAMDAMKRNKYEDARILLQTLINTYPDSEFLARAKLGVADTWYVAAGTANYTQAEAEYRDFITFFPNVPEAAEAQLKIAGIEYRQMDKADRDFTHAKAAEQEYRTLLQQYPDSKLVPEGKERLREVQEVLADREFRIGRYYYMRSSWPAAIARLQTLVDTYPLYSGASEALFLQADAYEKQAALVRNNKRQLPDEKARLAKERLLQDLDDHAAESYARLITRYPISSRAADARKRLEAMHRPVPRPTPEAIAQNKAEQESRGTPASMLKNPLGSFKHRPDFSLASKVGDPTLVDPQPISAPGLIRDMNDVFAGKATGAATNTVGIEPVSTGPTPASQPTPRATPGQADPGDPNAIPQLTPSSEPAAGKDPGSAAPAPPPQQINQAAQNTGGGDNSSSASTGTDKSGEDADSPQSSSKQPKKKGFRKIIPF